MAMPSFYHYIIKAEYFNNEIVRFTHDEIQTVLDEIFSLRLQMKLNPSFIRRRRFHLRRGFVPLKDGSFSIKIYRLFWCRWWEATHFVICLACPPKCFAFWYRTAHHFAVKLATGNFSVAKCPLRVRFPLILHIKKGCLTASSFYGAGGGNRTHTVSLPQDFESSASASSTTPANIKPPHQRQH